VNTPDKKPFREAAAPVYKEFGAQFGKEMVDKIIGTK
jgi:TRAP-type C4-dicarboxylate transport system substrate-binding protein